MMGPFATLKAWTVCALLRRVVLFQALLAIAGAARSSYEQFRFTVEPSDTIAVRGETALLNCSAAYHRRKPQMQWKRDGVYMNFEGDSRRYLLSNGSLHFTSVMHTRSHRPDEGVFQCVASLSDIGTIVSRKAKLQVAYLDRDFIEQPDSLTVHLGDFAMFACNIEGAPKPTVRWYKNEMEISEKQSINYRIHMDGVLEISNVQFSDLGRYKCKVSNVDRTRMSESASLIQNSDSSTYQGVKPYFIMKPKSKIAIEGTTVMLYCGANGRDRQTRQPTISWLKDGITIDMANLDSRFMIVGQGSLQISNLQASDAGSYTCRAMNLEDSVDADAVLTVHVPPRFIRKPVNKFAHVNKDIEFSCDIFGIPKPKITWIKNSDLVISSDYFQIIDGKNLRILGLVNSDSGIYQCFGENEVGNIQASAQLTILEPGQTDVATHQLPSAPRNLAAAIVSRRFVTLSWDLPDRSGPSEIVAYSVFWKEIGSNRERVMNVTQQEANVQHLKPATKYEFRVLAYNRLGPGKSMAEITATTQPDVLVPNPAKNLQAVPTSGTSIKVSWDPPDNLQPSGGRILNYKLNYYEVGDNEEKDAVTVRSGNSYVLTDLKPFTEYSFRVVAFNSNGMGMSTEEVVARTYSSIPSSPPQNVTVETASSKSIILRWEPVKESDQNGVITGYKIRYKRTNGHGNRVTTDGNRRAYPLTDLQKDTQYLVRISALTVNGSGPPSPWLTAKTLIHDLDETKVPGQPSSLKVRAYTDSIVVSWSRPVEQDVMIRGYRLGYGIRVPDTYRIVIDAKQRYYTIKKLKSSTEYVISLIAYNNVGEGRPTYETVKTREEDTDERIITPMDPPLGLKAIVLSATTIVVTWSDNTLGYNQRISDNRYYTVRYLSRAQSRKPKFINSTSLNVHVDNLKPNTEYEFSVKVIKGRRQSTWSLSVLNKTFEAVPSTWPRDLTPVSVEGQPTSVTLNWQPPRLPNGQITGYLVFFTTDNNLPDRSWVVDAVMGDRLTATIRDLSADTTYYFKVQARNSKGYGRMSPTVIFRTPKADGTGGGKITAVFDLDKRPSDKKDSSKEEQGGLSSNMLYIIIACIGGVALISIVIILFFFCRRRSPGSYRKRQGSAAYTKGKQSKGPSGVKDLKPPDLWIHHDMDLKNMEKSRNQEQGDGQEEKDEASVELMDKRRNSFINDHGYESHEEPEERYQRRPMRAKPIMIPVDAQPQPPREPIATAMAIPNGHMIGSSQQQPEIPTRPVYPRTQYNTQYANNPPRVHVGDCSSAPSSVRPQQPTSPYKKPPPAAVTPMKARSPMPVVMPQAPDVTQDDDCCELQKSYSTEELSAEMANLEGLMKDLNAITQQEFEC